MTMDVSRLGIVVESTGIKEATNALAGSNGNGGLARAADKAERSVAGLTASMSKLMSVNASASTQAWAQSLGQLSGVIANLQSQLQSLAANVNNVTNGLNMATSATNRKSEASERFVRNGNVVTNTLRAMATAATAYAGVNLLGSIVKQADNWQMMQARLQNATGSIDNAKTAQEQMFTIAQRLRVPLEDQVRLYTRMAPAMQRLGRSSDDAKNSVEAISTALQLGGANGAEMASVMTQLSQSYGSGILNGAEFNAVAENGQVIMKALMDYTGKTQSELKKMGSTGKLSINTLNDALMVALPKLREQFDNLPVTFEGGMQRIKNAWTRAMGQLGEDTGFNRQLSQSLTVFENLIPGIARGLGTAFIAVAGWLDQNKDKLTQIWDQVVGIAKDVWNLGSGILSWVGNLIGAGEEISVVGAMLFGVRVGVAALQDGFVFVAAILAKIGGLVSRVLLEPLAIIVNSLLSKILEGFGGLFTVMGAGAKAVGFDTIGDSLTTAGTAAGKLAGILQDANKYVHNLGTSLDQTSDALFDKLKDGKSALDKLFSADYEVDLSVKTKGKMDEKAWGANPNPKKTVDEKAAKAAVEAQEKFNKLVAEANAKLEEQLEIKRRLETFGLDYDKLGPAQKKVIEIEETIQRLQAKGASAKAIADARQLKAIYEKAGEEEKSNERTLERLRLEKDLTDKGATRVKQLQDEAQALELKAQNLGKAKGSVEEEELALARTKLTEMQAKAESDKSGFMAKQVELLQQEVAARERIAKAAGQIGQWETMKEVEKLLDPKKAEKFGDAIAKSFGRASEGVGKLVKAFQQWGVRVNEVKKYKTALDKMSDGEEKAKAEIRYTRMVADTQIANYADMAGAAKSFFKEGSKGYEVMGAAEKTFRIAQAAMQMEAFMRESGIIQAITSLFVTSKATETAAEVASVGPHVGAEAAKQQANAVTALTNALTAPFPANIAAFALVAAMLASIGVAVGAGGGGKGIDIAKQRQESQGTGTVFGDSAAKSESISKSIEILADNSDIALRYSSGMLASLKNIEGSLTGATNSVIRGRGQLTGSSFQEVSKMPSIAQTLASVPLLGGMAAGLLGGLFSSKKTLLDSGLIAGTQNVSDILKNGLQVSGYQDVNTKKKTFGVTTSNKNKRSYFDVDDNLNKEFGNVIEGMVSTLSDAASVLGLSADEVARKLENMQITLGAISLKGLSAADIQKQLEAVFSAIGDTMTQVAIPSVERFQQAGEGLLETAVRVASGVEVAQYELEKIGINTVVGINQLVKTQGDVGAEIVRQTLLMSEAGTGIGEIISTLQGEAADIAETYKKLKDVQQSLKLMGISEQVTRGLIRAAGGLESLQDALEEYNQGFFSEEERYGMKLTTLRQEFVKLGVAMPDTKAGFRTLVTALSSTGEAGKELAMKVLLLAGSFSEVADYYLQGNEEKLSAAHDDLRDAYERESEALTTAKERFLEFSKSLSEFKYDLLLGSDSPLNAQEKYALEQQRFEDILAKARMGDEGAIEKFQDVAKSFLEASRTYNASGTAYLSDFERVLAETSNLQALSDTMATDAEKQLEALQKQVEGIITVNESVLTVKQALDNIAALMQTTSGGLTSVVVPAIDGSHADGLGYVPFDGYIAELHKGETILTAQEAAAYRMDYSQYGRQSDESLVNEIKALREQVAALRDGQREQTGQLIAANYDAQERNAQAIVEGQRDVASSSNYSERVKVNLV